MPHHNLDDLAKNGKFTTESCQRGPAMRTKKNCNHVALVTLVAAVSLRVLVVEHGSLWTRFSFWLCQNGRGGSNRVISFLWFAAAKLLRSDCKCCASLRFATNQPTNQPQACLWHGMPVQPMKRNEEEGGKALTASVAGGPPCGRCAFAGFRVAEAPRTAIRSRAKPGPPLHCHILSTGQRQRQTQRQRQSKDRDRAKQSRAKQSKANKEREERKLDFTPKKASGSRCW